MAKPALPGKDPDHRRLWATPIGALLPAVTRPAFRRRAPAAAQLMADWPQIVGPALAAVTEPRRLAGGVLTIAAAGPVALELAHMTDSLRSRINGALGAALVQAIRVVQGHRPAPLAPPARRRPGPDPSGLPEGELGEALRGLHRAMTSR
jgi:hypothetical protein